ncbi:hypothetical protein A6V36_14930 [Paraburkholderia ginsengiterrae]|uniref:Uncharacterized protein n=1 Tax=Paraburkholderia ginsengiterrae TaxID=1462993 RepID=A0A1A9N621_9BURK|nr:hypothetical protein [Paraburkholderia ginsengiterrae]OAJ51859.1 hypothetical protein A6V36_14930 [Paraburkholderia ginsengiterrae]OAJ59967.1 hypothetical protein A6V37_26315 [Paraburkholderia ginsengiterrae]
MKTLTQTLLIAMFGAMSASAVYAADAAPAAPAAPEAHPKNWTPPSEKIYAQKLSDQIMAQHPELLSVTFHGTPPGMTDGYTMFAGSYHDRIGNADDPDDIDISKKGITIVDPRWHRPNDTVQKFVMMLPLRDAKGNNVGEIVLAYKNDAAHTKSETQFFLASTHLRDALAKQIPTFGTLFEAAK